jgi:hypothetical protein
MNTLVKASKAVKGSTPTVRLHLDAVERARELYLAQIRRAEAEYFDRITRATAIITGTEAAPEMTVADAPSNSHAAEAAQPAE